MPSYTWHDGFAMPMGFPPQAYQSALEYVPEPGDFFIVAYPKCGTTWAQHIVYLIWQRGRPLSPSASMTDAIPHLEECGGQAARDLRSPRYIKTHLRLGALADSDSAKYLYVARNPFDCAVSFFHHTRGFVKHYDFADGRFEDFFECFVAGEVDFGDYFDHLLSWYERRDRANVLFLTYEAMSDDPRRAVEAIGEFMGTDCLKDEAILGAVLEHSSFASMRKDQQRWSSQRPLNMPAFIRKGAVGDWVNHFSPSQAARLLEKFDERCAGTEIGALWPEVIAEVRRFAERAEQRTDGVANEH